MDNQPTPVEFKYLERISSLSEVVSPLEGSGFFLKRMIAQFCSTCFSLSLLLYSLSYLVGVPKITCRQSDGTYTPTLSTEACTKRNECIFSYEFDNWNKEYDLVCEREKLKDFNISMMFWTSSLANLLISTLVDFLGRKAVIVLGSSVYILLSVAIFFINSFELKMVLIGVMTGFDTNIISANSILVREMTKEGSSFNAVVVSYGFIFFSLGSIFIGIVTLYLKNTTSLWILFVLVFMATMVGNFFFYVESPVLLYKKKQGEEMLKSLVTLASVNGVKVDRSKIAHSIILLEHKEEGIKELTSVNIANKPNFHDVTLRQDINASLLENESTQSSPVLHPDKPDSMIYSTDECRLKSELSATPPQTSNSTTDAKFPLIALVMCIYGVANYFLFFGMAISIDSCGFDSIQLNAVMLGLSSIVGYYKASMINEYPRIRTATLICFCIIISTIANVVLGAFAPKMLLITIIRSLLTMVVINILVCFSFSLFYLYSSEAFPVTKRGLGIGLAVCSGKLFGSLSSFIKTYCLNAGVDPVLGFSIPMIIAIFAIQLLPETLSRQNHDITENLVTDNENIAKINYKQ